MTVLYHATDEEGIKGIKAPSFAVSRLPDSASNNWLSIDPDNCLRLAGRANEWLVTVGLADEIAEQRHSRSEDRMPYLGNYGIPWEVVNAYQSTFRFDRVQPRSLISRQPARQITSATITS
jgi:hypothetical protein